MNSHTETSELHVQHGATTGDTTEERKPLLLCCFFFLKSSEEIEVIENVESKVIHTIFPSFFFFFPLVFLFFSAVCSKNLDYLPQ